MVKEAVLCPGTTTVFRFVCLKSTPGVIVEDNAFSLVVSYEAGKVTMPIRLPPRDERGLSIGRKLKFTDLIGLANVDGMGWDRIGSDGIGWDRIGWDRTPF